MDRTFELISIVRNLSEFFLENGFGAAFRKKAKSLSSSITIEDLGELQSLFHRPIRESPVYSPEKHGYGGWLSACQFSIFELIYNLGEEALPFIREIAWGEYDWTQGNAIELLIRFAADGKHRDEIISEIKRNYSDIAYEAQLYAIEPLITDLDQNKNLKAVFNELMVIEQFRYAYQEIIKSKT